MGTRTGQGRAQLVRSQRFVAGDPLRGLAALMIIAVHAGTGAAAVNGMRDGDHAGLFGSDWGKLLDAGNISVPVFFCLSGYLVGRPFVRAFASGTSVDVGTYLRRRALRIVPVWWLVCLVAVGFYGLHGSSPLDVLSLLGFAQIYAPAAVHGVMVQGWTLDVEVFFYLLLPIAAIPIAWLCARASTPRRRTRRALWILVAIAVVGWVAGGAGVMPGQWAGAAPWSLLRAFLPGILMAAAEIAWADRLAGWRRGPLVAAWIGGVALVLGLVTAMQGASPDQRITLGTMLVVAPWLAQHTAGVTWRVIDNRPLHWLGERSYGLYVLHWPLLLAIRPLFEDYGPRRAFVAFLVADVAISVAGAAILFRVVETPLLRRRSRIGARPALEAQPA